MTGGSSRYLEAKIKMRKNTFTFINPIPLKGGNTLMGRLLK